MSSSPLETARLNCGAVDIPQDLLPHTPHLPPFPVVNNAIMCIRLKLNLSLASVISLKVHIIFHLLQVILSSLFFGVSIVWHAPKGMCAVCLCVWVECCCPNSFQFCYDHPSQSHHCLSPGLLKTCLSSFNFAPFKWLITQQSNFLKNLNRLGQSSAKNLFDFPPNL